ncbi:hypothetical protein LCGC14_2322240, partial [marine sediment metagenome]
FIPIIPFLEDSENNMEDVIRKSKEAGADFLLFSPGLSMRDSQAEFFLKKLKDSKHSKIIKPLLNLYKGQMQPPSDYVKTLHLKLLSLCQKYDLAVRINVQILLEKKWPKIP